MPTSDEPKCPVSPETRDIWLRQSKNAQPEQISHLNAVKSTQSTLNQSTSWSWRNLIWSPVTASDRSLSKTSNPAADGCPVPHGSDAAVPKDHPHVPGMVVNSEPEAIECRSDEIDQSLSTPSNATSGSNNLGEERAISSIPRTNSDGNWIYPSEKQFFNAMIRKQWNPEEADMKTVVPLHNMVNEVAWKYILMWEQGQGGDKCGGIELTSFKGDAKKITPRAMVNHYIFGRDLPFDRHDWSINRCGTDIDYVIDFYTTPVTKPGEEPKFYLDVRPKLNSVEGCRMRLYHALGL